MAKYEKIMQRKEKQRVKRELREKRRKFKKETNGQKKILL